MKFDDKDFRRFRVAPEVLRYIKEYSPKIAIIAPSLDTVPSKRGNAIYTLIEDIASYSRYPILIFSVDGNDLIPSKISNRIIYYKPPFKKLNFYGLMGYRLRKFFFGVTNVIDFQFAYDVFNLCGKLNVKCLVIEDSNALLQKLPTQSSKGVKVVLHQHIIAPFYLTNYHWRKFQRKISEIVFVAKSSKLEVESKHGSLRVKSKVIYNGVNLANYRESDISLEVLRSEHDYSQNVRILLYVGRIIKEKGVLELCRAVNLIRGDFVLLLIGQMDVCDFSSQVLKMASESNDKIRVLGSIVQESIALYYQISDFVIVPSMGYEGLPKVVTEALVMGKPLVASDRGGIWELVEENINGIKIGNPVDASAIAYSINIAFAKEELLKKNAQERQAYFRKELSSQEMSKEFDSVFENYIGL